MKKCFIKQEKSSLLQNVLLSYLLCIFAPLELYAANVSEFWFDIYILFPVCIGMFLVAVLLQGVVFEVAYRLSERAYRVCVFVHFAVIVCLYVQGNYLVGNLPALDGTTPDFSVYGVEKIQSFVLWIGVFALTGILVKWVGMYKYKKLISFVSAVALLMLMTTNLTVCSINDAFLDKQSMVETDKGILTMSKDKNFVILVLDAFDSKVFAELLEVYPEYKESFVDFTFYPDTVSIYPYTQETIPFLFSGDVYENGEPFADWERRCYEESPLLERLEQDGFRMGAYTQAVVADDVADRFENIVGADDGISNVPKFAKLMLKYVALRYAPYQLKDEVFSVMTTRFEDFRTKADQEADNWHFFESNHVLMELLAEKQIDISEEKSFRFIHLDGAHSPFYYNKDVEFIAEGTYEQSAAAALTVTAEYLCKLREADVYNNTAIVVLADHGYGDNQLERYDPMLMVKGIGESHPFAVSDEAISYLDLQDAYENLLDGKTGEEVFDTISGQERERRYIFYRYNEEEYMEEYYIKGYVQDPAALHKTGKEYIRQ